MLWTRCRCMCLLGASTDCGMMYVSKFWSITCRMYMSPLSLSLNIKHVCLSSHSTVISQYKTIIICMTVSYSTVLLEYKIMCIFDFSIYNNVYLCLLGINCPRCWNSVAWGDKPLLGNRLLITVCNDRQANYYVMTIIYVTTDC